METQPKHSHGLKGALLGILFITTVSTALAEPSGSGLQVAISEARPLSQLTFRATTTTFLPGKGRGTPDETAGALGIALIFAQNNYWQDSRWSAAGYNVSSGILNDSENRLAATNAWKISPPQYAANFSFTASGNDLFFRFPSVEDYVVYTLLENGDSSSFPSGSRILNFANSKVIKLATIPGESIVANGFTKIPAANLHLLNTPRTYFFLPESTELRPDTEVSNGLAVARNALTDIARVSTFSIDVSPYGFPEDSDSTGRLPGHPYGAKPGITVLPDGSGGVRAIWQDVTSKQLFLTELAPDLSYQTTALPHFLGRVSNVVQDESGNLFYVSYTPGESPQILLAKVSPSGASLISKQQSTLAAKLNIRDMSDYWDSVRLAYANGKLCVTYMRGMHNGHQGSIIVSYDTQTLNLIRNYGQNSSHSFDSRLAHDGTNFFNLSLGDNYPRGLAFDRITPTGRSGKVIYTYKTKHYENQNASNDNRTYTEIGDLTVNGSGYGVVIASESGTDNTLATGDINESRNLGYLLVAPQFHTIAQSEYIVPNGMILSPGTNSPLFGFYNFGGGYVRQQYRGVRWLTNYSDSNSEHATRPKMVLLPDGTQLILWEKWNRNHHVSTHGIKIDSMGNPTSPAVNLSSLRLSDGGSVAIDDSHLYGITANGRELQLSVIETNIADFKPIKVLDFDFNKENGSLRIDFQAIPGSTYALQSAPALQPNDWTTLPNTNLTATSSIEFLEAAFNLTEPRRFWRIVKVGSN